MRTTTKTHEEIFLNSVAVWPALQFFLNKNIISDLEKLLADVTNASLYPHLDSIEKRARIVVQLMEYFEVASREHDDFMAAWLFEIVKLNELFDQKLAALLRSEREREDWEKHQRLVQLLDTATLLHNWSEIIKNLSELQKLQEQVHMLREELQRIYQELSSTIRNAFNQLQDQQDHLIEIPNSDGLTISHNAMIAYVGKRVADRVANGELRATDLDKGINEAIKEFVIEKHPTLCDLPSATYELIRQKYIDNDLSADERLQKLKKDAVDQETNIDNMQEKINAKRNQLPKRILSVVATPKNDRTFVQANPISAAVSFGNRASEDNRPALSNQLSRTMIFKAPEDSRKEDSKKDQEESNKDANSANEPRGCK